MPNYWYDHVHLMSPDPVATAQFYEKMFDAEKVGTRETSDGRTAVELKLSGSRVLVTQRQAPAESASTPPVTGGGLDHFGIKTDNLEAAVADLKAKGVKFRDEIRVIRPGVKICFMWAPDNVLIELLETA
ncbi:MAG: VOC family protein [Dehalococcoidia bacterium]